MPRIIFVHPDGRRQEVEAGLGKSVMETALDQGVEGIIAECNGSAACATCHAYFDESSLDLLPPISEHEEDMLDFAASQRLQGSRLSCQITVTDAMEGMCIQLPESQ